jgi:hypothetical protein
MDRDLDSTYWISRCGHFLMARFQGTIRVVCYIGEMYA